MHNKCCITGLLLFNEVLWFRLKRISCMKWCSTWTCSKMFNQHMYITPTMTHSYPFLMYIGILYAHKWMPTEDVSNRNRWYQLSIMHLSAVTMGRSRTFWKGKTEHTVSLKPAGGLEAVSPRRRVLALYSSNTY